MDPRLAARVATVAGRAVTAVSPAPRAGPLARQGAALPESPVFRYIALQ